MSKLYALIVAGGSGSRMNAEIPKQFICLNELPILMHTLRQFYSYNNEMELVLVLPKSQFSYWNDLCAKHYFTISHRLVEGGEVRFESVYNGLKTIEEDSIVAIHDGVRPFVSHETIARCIATTLEKGNAIPVVPVIDSLRKVEEGNSVAVDRSNYVNIQTPQCFRVSEIQQAYALGYDPQFTDDAMALERYGKTIHLVDGNRENIKITHPTDLIIAEALFKNITSISY